MSKRVKADTDSVGVADLEEDLMLKVLFITVVARGAALPTHHHIGARGSNRLPHTHWAMRPDMEEKNAGAALSLVASSWP